MENMNKTKILSMLKEMITVPKKEYVDFSIDLLNYMNALDKDKITNIGKIINQLNLDIKEAVSLIYSHFFKCSNLMCYIIAIIHISNNQFSTFFSKDRNEDQKEKQRTISKFYHELGDIFTILKIYKQFRNAENKEEWCLNNYFSYQNLNKISETKKKLKMKFKKVIDEINNLEIVVETYKSKKQNAIQSLSEGYKTNIAIHQENTKFYENTYPKIKTKTEITRDTSLIYFPKKIFYLELANILNNKKFNMCTVISKV